MRVEIRDFAHLPEEAGRGRFARAHAHGSTGGRCRRRPGPRSRATSPADLPRRRGVEADFRSRVTSRRDASSSLLFSTRLHGARCFFLFSFFSFLLFRTVDAKYATVYISPKKIFPLEEHGMLPPSSFHM